MINSRIRSHDFVNFQEIWTPSVLDAVLTFLSTRPQQANERT